jgi:multiple sugar transport system permease protein
MKGGVYAVALLVLAAELFPVFWMAMSSFKTRPDIFNWPPTMIPRPWTLSNYLYIFQQMSFGLFLRNSVIIAALTTTACAVVGVPAAFAISRFRTGGRPLSLWILMQRMIPSVALVIPLFILLWKIQLMDTWAGLAIAHVSFNLPFAVWLMVAFFAEVPGELEEAALVDGCTRFQAFRRVSLPLVLAGLVTMAVLVSIQSWNEFLFAVVLTSSDNAQTIPVAIATLVNPVTDILYGEMCAAAVISIVPVFIFALAVQKYLVRGITAGAVKG